MRILFLESHPLCIYGLPNGLRDLGHEVMISGPLTEQNIPEMIREFSPKLIVTMCDTYETTPEKQVWIRNHVKSSGIPHVYWATEDPTHTEEFSLPYVATTCPDFVFTICKPAIDIYKSLGFKAAHMDFGYHPSIHHRTPCIPEYSCNIAVVANAYPRVLVRHPGHFRNTALQVLISSLLKENIRVDFWGGFWEHMGDILGQSIPPEWIHGYLTYTEANKVYSSADIVIGLQNQKTQLTQRTYEVLGSEGLLLTIDTPEVRRLFIPGSDLLVSSCPEETVSIVRHYLNSPEECESIRKQGSKSVRPHSYTDRAAYMIEVLHKQEILK